MIRHVVLALYLMSAAWATLWAAEPVEFAAPGFPSSRMEADGRLVEDWGSLKLVVEGEGVNVEEATVQAVRLEEIVPAAAWSAGPGPVQVTATAYRAPVFPAGMDVLTVKLVETSGRDRRLALRLEIDPPPRVGLSTAQVDQRTILAIPLETQELLELRDWGYTIDTTPLPSWAKPEGACDPAFANIRAGMGGIPIGYRFRVAPRSQANVVLGICESHWDRPQARPLLCQVEGARPMLVDPIERWGRHQPGVLLFAASDSNGDGWITVAIKPVPGAPDRNPILNVIWVFAGDRRPNLQRVAKGQLNEQALYYVDVGGARDQPILAGQDLRFPVELPANGSKELAFYVACPGGSVVTPEMTAWTPQTLYQAAKEVWQAWPQSTVVKSAGDR
ncbi:MAG: hypothetical protein GYA33_14095 [Thermogutta sp.]|nr:hypothetical protein [Thermogutta sp.]